MRGEREARSERREREARTSESVEREAIRSERR